MDELHLQLMGGFTVQVGERKVAGTAWTRRKARSLVQLLALAPAHRRHRDQLTEALWPGQAAETGRFGLHSLLRVARRAFEPDLAPHTPSAYLALTSDQNVVLCPAAPLWIDVEAFTAASRRARAQREPQLYVDALALYGGPLLPEEPYSDWTALLRENLRQEHLRLLRELAGLQESQHDLVGAIATRQHLVGEDPTDESAHAGLMRLFALTGQRHLALRQYRQVTEVLRREVDAEPSASTRRLHQAILTDELPDAAATTTRPRLGAASIAPSPAPSSRCSASALPLASTRETPSPSPSPQPNSPPNRLPRELTTFVGREAQVAEIAACLEQSTLLTLTGIGGIGKTRLAVAVAAQVQGRFGDGVSFTDLAALQDPDGVTRAVADALAVRESVGQPLIETLVRVLEDRQCLLVLDNCEHLVGACAHLVERLLRAAPRLRVLATSREVLGAPGEISYRVPSLTVPDAAPNGELSEPGTAATLPEITESEAVRLFVERAVAARRGFALNAQNVATVARICQRLDGIPLALELAAARISVLSVEQLLARLDDRFQLLTHGPRTALPRQQTLRATLDWSHDLLAPPERALFRRLSVFAGGWTLAAAEHVCGGGPLAPAEIVDLLAGLADKSLVAVTEPPGTPGEVRYSLLETVRQYARERLLAANELEETQARRLRHYTCLAVEAEAHILGSAQLAWIRRLELDRGNCLAALDWSTQAPDGAAAGLTLATALVRFWTLQGRLSEGRPWLETVLAAPGAVNAAPRARALVALGRLALWQNDLEPAHRCLEEGLALCRAASDLPGVAQALLLLGDVARGRGEVRRATALVSDSLAICEALQDHHSVASARGMLGRLARDAGELTRALDLLEASAAAFREIGDAERCAWTLRHLGIAHLFRGNLAEATRHTEQSLLLCTAIGDLPGQCVGLRILSRIAIARGDYQRSAHFLGTVRARWAACGIRPDHNFANTVGEVQAALGAEMADAALTRGRTMSLEEALVAAQHLVHENSGAPHGAA